MRGDNLDLAVDWSTLGQLESAAGFEERVQAVENRRTAKVSILDQQPVAVLHGLDEGTVNPFEACGSDRRLGG